MRLPLFPVALLLSLALHAGAALWLGAPAEVSAVEIDLTRPISAGPGQDRAPAAPASGAAVPLAAEASSEPEPLSAEGDEQLPSGTSIPTGMGADAQAGLDQLPGGAPGGGSWSVPVRPPVLLQPDKIRAELRRLYPAQERGAGREGEVLADLRVDAEGRVLSFEIVRSAGAAFDEAAGKALGAMRFSPALAGTRPVAVKVRQRISFRLD